MSLPEPLSAEGSQALRAIISSPSETLIATDFEGTLAPMSVIRTRRTRTGRRRGIRPAWGMGARCGRDHRPPGPHGSTSRSIPLLVGSLSSEEEALTEVSDVIVDGPAGLAAWLNALAERLEGRA